MSCGSIQRPLNPREPEGLVIDVHFAVSPAKVRDKRADAVYFLAGGPGQSAIEVMPMVLAGLSRLNNRRDLVFVDQRGTGRSAPLKCEPEPLLPIAEALDPARLPARMARCRTALAKLPYADLRQFSTTIAMADLDAVRKALGHERINLIGASYGTRAALEYLRLQPKHVRRVVLDGVAPPDMALPQSLAVDSQSALERLFTDCAADTDCARRHPHLRQKWEALFADLPKAVSVDHPLTGAHENFKITREMIAALVRTPLYAPSLAAALPTAIDEAAAGRWAPLLGLSSVMDGRSGNGIAMGMHFSVICAEDFPPKTGANLTGAGHFAHVFDAPYSNVCAQWPKSEVDTDFYRIPASTVPSLIFSGGVDPATAPRHAERVARALGERSRHVVVPNAGHGIMAIGCASDLVFRFINAAEDSDALSIDSACLGDIPRPGFFVPLGARLGDEQ